MDTRWERLAGDPNVFAIGMAFTPDPDGGRYIDPETGLSWGSFQIWVEGRNLCSHLEKGERIDSAHWYLLPLLEWFARYWNPLLHEERLPVKVEGDTGWTSLHATRFPPPAIEDDEERASEWESAWQDWWMRHGIRAAREGGLFPDVVIRRFRDSVEVSWGPVRSEDMSYRFDSTESAGFGRFPPRTVAEPLHAVLSGASEYLLSLANESPRINEFPRIEALSGNLQVLGDSAGHHDRRLMWLAGLGTDEPTVRAGWERAVDCLSGVQAGWQQAVNSLSDPAEAPRRAMLEVSESPLVVTGSCQAALMFGSLAPDVMEQDVLNLARAMVDLYSPGGDSEAMREICHAAPVEEPTSPAWSQGYELADVLHRHFHGEFAEGESADVEGLIEKLDIRVETLELSDERVRGVSIAGPRHRPGIIVNSNHAANRHSAGCRFTLAHELCHLLFDREAGRRLAIASGPWAPRDVERRANAFAAMLLMPTSLVQQAVATLSVPVATVEGIREVASRLRAGRSAVLNHLKNLGFIDEVDQQRIEDQALLTG